jgi:hypothetical protein
MGTKATETADTAQIPQMKAKSGVADGVKIGAGMFIVLPILLIVGGFVLLLTLGMCSSFF